MNTFIRTAVVAAALLAAPVVFASKPAQPGAALTADASARFVADPAGTPTLNLPVDISGRQSPGLACAGSVATRPTLTVPVGANAVITGLGWNVLLETVGASWASEATLVFGSQSEPELINLRVGAGTNDPTPAGGTNFASAGIVDLSDAGLSNIQLDADGLLYIGFCEGFADNAGAVDANYLSPSTITVACSGCVAPAPSVGLSLSTLSFGEVLIGDSSAPQSVTLSNTGTATGVIQQAAVSAPFARSGGTCAMSGDISLAADASCTLEYSFTPTVAQASNQTLSFGGDGAGLSLSLTGTGVSGLPPAVSRPAVVPVDSPWALSLLAMVLAGFAAFSLRKRS